MAKQLTQWMLAVVLAGAGNWIIAQNSLSFNTRAGMLTGRYGHGSTTDGSYVYAVAGAYAVSPYRTRNIERYDPASDTWSVAASGLIPRRYGSAEFIASQGKVYIFNGGIYSSYTDTIEVYTPATGSILYLTSNPYPVNYAGSAVRDSTIYVFGGDNASGNSNRLYAFSPASDTWVRLADMPEAKQTSGQVVDSVLYVFGGYSGTVSTRIDAYDIVSNTWSLVGSLPTGISAHTTAAVGQFIFIVGDYASLTYTAVFDTKSMQLHQITSNITGRRHAGAEIIGDSLYVFGGTQSSAGVGLASTEISDIATLLLTLGIDEEHTTGLPEGIVLHPNYPNPFNPSTTIGYENPVAGVVSLIVYDILGQEIMRLVDGHARIGTYKAEWGGLDATGRAVPSGIYIARLETSEYNQSIKMVLLK